MNRKQRRAMDKKIKKEQKMAEITIVSCDGCGNRYYLADMYVKKNNIYSKRYCHKCFEKRRKMGLYNEKF